MTQYKIWYLMHATKGESDVAGISRPFAREEEADAEAARLLLDDPHAAVLLLEGTKLFTASMVRETKKLREAPLAAREEVEL